MGILCGIKGINDVRFTSLRPGVTRIERVAKVGSTELMLTKTGRVVTHNKIIVKNALIVKGYYSMYRYSDVIECLYKLRVIEKDDRDIFFNRMQNEYYEYIQDTQVKDFIKSAKELGIKLTKDQKRLLKSKRHLHSVRKEK